VVPEDGTAAYPLEASDWVGPLDAQVSQALSFVSRSMAVQAREEQVRVDMPRNDLTTVFEALVKAVAGSKIRLRMFADRLELNVPGALTNTMTVESLALWLIRPASLCGMRRFRACWRGARFRRKWQGWRRSGGR
jgi:predicted HTH transcriptional regulator